MSWLYQVKQCLDYTNLASLFGQRARARGERAPATLVPQVLIIYRGYQQAWDLSTMTRGWVKEVNYYSNQNIIGLKHKLNTHKMLYCTTLNFWEHFHCNFIPHPPPSCTGGQTCHLSSRVSRDIALLSIDYTMTVQEVEHSLKYLCYPWIFCIAISQTWVHGDLQVR